MQDAPVTPPPLTADRLYHAVDPARLPFATTKELADLDRVLGQERAVEAIRFGARIRRPGYNLFVFGPPGTGKHSTVRAILAEKAASEPSPPDRIYLNDFANPHRPRALAVPSGHGGELAAAMQRVVEDIRAAVPAAFESDDYRNRLQSIDEHFREQQEEAFSKLRHEAEARSAVLIRTPMGFALAPVRNGEVLKPDAFEALTPAERKEIQETLADLQHKLEALLRNLPRVEKGRRDAVRDLNREVTALTVDHPIAELKARFAVLPEIVEHLAVVRDDLVENVHTLLGGEAIVQQTPQGAVQQALGAAPIDGFRRYQINVLVDNSGLDHAPVIYEDHPTLGNLVGRIEHVPQMGALVTDFTLIRSGALHRANGGYLVLDALKLLTQPFAWEALKRALKSARVKIESAGEMLSLVSTVSLEPEPIALDLKVVLCGEPWLYYALERFDPDFPSLFKVAADFDSAVRRDDEGDLAYARLIATMVRREGLRHLDRAGVARVIEHGARLADDAERLSVRLELVADLLREADHMAGEANSDLIGAAHVQQALDAQVRRADRMRERMDEAIQRDIVRIDSEGAAVGQVNGLSVYQLGHFAFGKPTRITASVRLGAGKVVDIEREVALGGPLHSKGVLILSGFLASRYAPRVPLSLSASLVFEQSYGGVEGDSASSAELYALLSALAELPLHQSLAVTGSVDQQGRVQAIGGVNEKIEGFFDVCRARGLSGDQGVLIPESNVQHLMLRADVVEACRAGRFHVYPVARIDQGLALLTGRRAGERGPDGAYPEDSVNRLVEDRLVAFAEARRGFARSEGGEGAKP